MTTARNASRPKWQWLAVILLGGMLGTATRAGLAGAFPSAPGTWPWTTFWINLAGSFLLGVLLELLAVTGADAGWRRGVRLGVGTGVMGGFTTYSTFSVETVQLLSAGAWLIGLGYALASVLLGIGLAGAGLVVGRRIGERVRP